MDNSQHDKFIKAYSDIKKLAITLCGNFAVKEIERASEYLGGRLTDEQRQQILKQDPEQILQAAQLMKSTVALRQQIEIAEGVRRNIEKMELMAALSPKGPVS